MFFFLFYTNWKAVSFFAFKYGTNWNSRSIWLLIMKVKIKNLKKNKMFHDSNVKKKLKQFYIWKKIMKIVSKFENRKFFLKD